MDCKFTLLCKTCNCKTEISAEHWLSPGRFECPCCHSEFSKNAYPALTASIEAIALLPADTEAFSVSVTYPWDKEHHS